MPDLNKLEYYYQNPNAYYDFYKSDPDTYTGVPVYQAFKDFLGRAPTKEEFAIYQPLVVSLGHEGAKSEIAKYAQQEANSPDKLDEKRRKELEAKAPEYFGSVDAQIKNLLGRDATDAERKHFGGLLASGDLDEYTFQQFIQSSPEYAKTQDEQFRQGLRQEMSDSDKRYLSESVLPAIQSKYALAGRSLDSSAFAAQMANAAQQQNVDREKYLSGLAASMYGGRQDRAYGDYTTNRDRMYGLQDYYRTSRDQNVMNNYNRLNQLQDFDIQRKTYENYLRKYGKRGGAASMIAGGIQGGASGAMAGGMAGGPWGALAGGLAGFGLGAYGGSGK